MKAQCHVYLNGVPLEGSDPSLIPLDFTCRPVFFDRPALIRAGAPGVRRPAPLLKEYLACVTFEAHEADPAGRQRAIDRLLARAARGGWLTAEARPGLRLAVKFRSLSPVGTLHWTRTLELTLAAEARPYWEATEPTAAFLYGRQAEGTMPGPGYAAPPPVSVWIRPEGAMTRLSVTAGETRVSFSGLSVAAGQQVLLTRDENDLFTAVNGGTGESLYGCLSADSDDGLYLQAGENARIAIDADAPCRASFEARGLYL